MTILDMDEMFSSHLKWSGKNFACFARFVLSEWHDERDHATLKTFDVTTSAFQRFHVWKQGFGFIVKPTMSL